MFTPVDRQDNRNCNFKKLRVYNKVTGSQRIKLPMVQCGSVNKTMILIQNTVATLFPTENN